jgi:hypothetical protein
MNKMPDVVLEENSTLYDVFDLDDYFMDRDNDSLFFTSGYFHLRVDIDDDNTVDITSLGQWTGSELATFRAEDPIGAIVEDTILVTVRPVNDGPMISGVPDLVVHYDYPYSFDLSPYIEDLDNETSELSVWTSEPTNNIWIQYYNNLGIVVNYPAAMLGMTIPVTIFVSDGIETVSQQIEISVTEDHPPELRYKLPDIVFEEDTFLENAFTLSNYFIDLDNDTLYYTNGTTFINVVINENLTVDFSAPENWYGFETVTFRATDPYGALVEDKILVIVVPVNDPPVIGEIPRQDMKEGERWLLELSQFIYDIDNDLSDLIIALDSESSREYVELVGTILIFNYPEGTPSDVVTITVDDGQQETSGDVVVGNPVSVPTPPTIWDLIPWPWLFAFFALALACVFAIYKKKSQYRVLNAFCIHDMGLPIAHVSRESSTELDDIVVSGMFTAVQDFINDSLDGKSIKDDWELDEMRFGEHKILIERIPDLYFAVIFEGNGGKLRNRINNLIEDIEEDYRDELDNWDGDLSKIAGIRDLMMGLIPEKAGEKGGEI